MFQTLEMQLSGIIIIALIIFLFLVAIFTLFSLYGKYRRLQVSLAEGSMDSAGFISRVKTDFVEVYGHSGVNTNTPAIIDNAAAITMKGSFTGERFLNNSVSLMVTLGLLGTFLGLALSVNSLTELITLSADGEWLSVLDSVGGGLLSALSGMGVAFYTSLVGVTCAIILTLLRSVFSPEAQREKLYNMLELWLDHDVAAKTPTQYASDDATIVKQLQGELRAHAEAVRTALGDCTREMAGTLGGTTAFMQDAINSSAEQMERFSRTVARFNDNVRDFSEFNHHLRNNIERMDVNFIRLTESMREAAGNFERSGDR